MLFQIASYPLSAQTRAWMNRLSGLPSMPFLITLDKFLIRPLVNAGIWGELDYLALYATETQGQASTPLKNTNTSNYYATLVNSPAFNKLLGFTFNDSTNYLDTNWIPSSNAVKFTQNEGAIFAYNRTNSSAATDAIMGISDGISRLTMAPRVSGDFYRIYVNSDISLGINITNTNTSGFFHSYRSSSTTIENFRNANNLGQVTGETSQSLNNSSVYVGAENSSGTPNLFSPYNISLTGIGSNLINPLNLYQIIQNYATIMGWNV